MRKVRTRKKSLVMRICVLCFAGYIVVTLISLQMEISAKREELLFLQEQTELQSTQNKETERLISYSKDEANLSKIARDRLDLGFSDEHVYRDAAGS